jgi:two-component system CheB/CheR fusion protein
LAVEDSIFLPKPYRVVELLAAIEELKLGNEQLSSINGELAFATAELETSKGELELLNEDLRAANAQLKARVRELTRANCDIADLLNGARIAMVFFDQKFAIKSFTLAAMDLFDLEEGDIGGPISRIGSRLRLDALHEEAERVLRTLGACEKLIESADGFKRYMMRILPYRTPRNVIAGVVINFVDVTLIAAAEAESFGVTRELRNQVDKMERILDRLPAGVFVAGADPTQNIQVNRYAVRLLGEDAAQKGPRDLPVPYRLFDQDRELAFWEQPLQRAALTGKAVPARPARLVRWDGSAADVMMAAEPLLDEHGAPSGAIAAVIELSDRGTRG